MEIYDSEDEQLDAVKKWWKANGRSILAGVLAGIVAVVGWNLWSNYRQARLQEASLMYDQLEKAFEAEQFDVAEQLSARIVEQHGKSLYGTFAKLYQARLKVDAGDLDGAEAILQGALNSIEDEHFKHIVRLRLGRVLLAKGEYEAGLKLMAEVDPSRTKSFEAAYEELTGDFYVGLDRIAEAHTAYQRALSLGQGSPLLPMKLDDVSMADVVDTNK